MKIVFILFFIISLALSNDGIFIGFGAGNANAKFEASGYTKKSDLTQRYNVDETYSRLGFDVIVGYKSFLTKYFAYRIYGEFDYYPLGKLNAPQGSTADGINMSAWNFGANADFIAKPFDWLGVYVGGYVGYLSTSNIIHQGYSTFEIWGAEYLLGNVNYGINVGADLSFGRYNQHSLEFYGKINLNTLQDEVSIPARTIENAYLVKEFNLPTIKAKFQYQGTLGLRYVYYFVSNDYTNKVNNKITTQKRKEEEIQDACPKFEREDLHNVKNNSHFTSDELEKGIVKIHGKTLYCKKLKVLKRTSQTRSFAVNDNKTIDFDAKITKETIIAQKIKNGKIVEKNVNIVHYTIEPIRVVKMGDLFYKEDSPYLKNIQKQMNNAYYEQRKKIVESRACFNLGNQTYCDGDLIETGSFPFPLMIRVDATGISKMVNYSLYLYINGKPFKEAGYNYYSFFRMERPKVYGNHELNSIEEPRLPQAHLLSIYEVLTFKEW